MSDKPRFPSAAAMLVAEEFRLELEGQIAKTDAAVAACAFYRDSMNRAASEAGCNWLDAQLQLAHDLDAEKIGQGYVEAERFRPVVVALRKAVAWMEGAQNSHIDSATRGLLACEIVEVHRALTLARELLPES